ncbi:MAG: ADOP family duplicated permease [Terriglobia bacterium]
MMRWYQRLFRRSLTEKHLDAELRFHLEQQIADYVAAGMTPKEARRRARLDFGGLDQVKEECRDVGAARFIETLIQDVRYGLRQLRRNPGFTAVAVLTLALGIGATTAIFSVVDAVMLKMLPVAHPEQLVLLRWESPHETTDYLPYPTFDDLQKHDLVFSGMFGFHGLPLATSIEGKPGLAAGQLVSGSFFQTLGVKASIGRTFTSEEDRVPGGDPVAVISYDYWKRQFALNLSAVGKSLVLNGTPFTIIGVTPPGFFGVTVGDSPDIWIPLMMEAQVMDGKPLLDDPKSWWLEVMARRKPEISELKATAAINVLYQQIARQQAGTRLSPEAERELAQEKIAIVSASKGLSDLRSRFSKPLLVVMALVSILLLIACANIASLALARASARHKEMAVRSALGAGRLRLMRQLLTESLLLAIMGGSLGLLLAYWGDSLLLLLLSTSGTSVAPVLHPDAHVFIFALCVSVLTGILVGGAPTWNVTRIDLNASLKAHARSFAAGSQNGRSPWELRRVLVVSEIAMALLLLVGAGMLVRSLEKLNDVDPGFDQKDVLLIPVDPTLTGYQGTRLTILYKRLVDAVSSVPGVQSESLSALPPMTSAQWRTGVFVQGHIPGPHENTTALMNMIGPGFFRTLGIPMLQGRDFTLRDNATAPEVAIINETMARHYFGHDLPIGKRLSFRGPGGGEIEIIGVAKDIKYNSLREVAPRMIYVPYLQTPSASLPFGMTLEVRTAGNPDNYVGSIRGAIRSVESKIPILGFTTLAERVNQSLGQDRLVAELSSFFGLLALLLASVGLYGVMTYMVTQRTSEIGIRMALGAQRLDVLWLVLREALGLVAIGLACGVPVTLAFTRIISNQLYGITPYDLLSFAVVILFLTAVAALAGYIPARRAMKVDPIEALRHE